MGNLRYFFILGKRSEDPEDPDWVPNIFPTTKANDIRRSVAKKRSQERYRSLQKKRALFSKKVEKVEESTCIQAAAEVPETTSNSKDAGTQYECEGDPFQDLRDQLANQDQELRARNEEIYLLRKENERLKTKPATFGINNIKSDHWINFFTGLPTFAVFFWVLDLVKDTLKLCHSRVSSEDHLLIILMKLRLGLLNKDIAQRFGITENIVSKIFRSWLPKVAEKLKFLIIWPNRATIRINLPQSFLRKFRDCVCIIDCTEIFIERATNLTARAQTWSNYKHNNTCKYLIGISPAGAVMFLSSGWGGRVSDKQITIDSGFLDKIQHGDLILADRGFLIKDDLNQRGAILKIPSFTKGKKQLSANEVDESRLLSRVRIHVERVIGRLKTYRILQTSIPMSQVDLLDDFMIVISACVNLNKSVVCKSK